MSILAECPICHRKQGVKNRLCLKCSEDLVKQKKAKKVRYWISYRLPGGKTRRESVGFSIKEAQDAEGKRKSQKRENKIFDILPEAKMTFNELTKWYLGLKKVRALGSFWRIEIALNKFNSEFGDTIVSQIKAADLENYQANRLDEGKAPATIDQEVGGARTMIIKAFDNDMVGGDTLRTFKRAGKMLKGNANARDRILSQEEYKILMIHLPAHLKPIFSTGFYTGMRASEILKLTWDRINLKTRFIKLEAEDTKDKEAREIPILDELYIILKEIPRNLHSNYVFLYNGKPIKDTSGSLKRACRLAEIPYGRFVKNGFVFHDLRHTFNTNMRKAGVPESVIMEITGHSTRVMFDRYNTIDREDKQQAVARLREFLQSGDQNGDQIEI